MINIEEKENDEGSNSCFEKIKYEKRVLHGRYIACLLYTSPSPRDA